MSNKTNHRRIGNGPRYEDSHRRRYSKSHKPATSSKRRALERENLGIILHTRTMPDLPVNCRPEDVEDPVESLVFADRSYEAEDPWHWD